jgi:hypothetical protein
MGLGRGPLPTHAPPLLATLYKGDFAIYGKAVFTNYYAELRATVPADNLLEYRMGKGWGPLCEFLEVDVPKGKKFPHTNDTDGFVDRCKARNRAQMMNVAFRALVWAGESWRRWCR